MNEIAIIITLLGNVRTAFASLMILALQLSKVVERLYLLTCKVSLQTSFWLCMAEHHCLSVDTLDLRWNLRMNEK